MSFAAVPNSFALARKNLPLSPDIGMHLPPLDPLPETSITQSLVRLPVHPVCPVNSRLWRTARQPDPACSFGFWSCLRFTDGPRPVASGLTCGPTGLSLSRITVPVLSDCCSSNGIRRGCSVSVTAAERSAFKKNPPGFLRFGFVTLKLLSIFGSPNGCASGFRGCVMRGLIHAGSGNIRTSFCHRAVIRR
jgi:hypothetical protein